VEAGRNSTKFQRFEAYDGVTVFTGKEGASYTPKSDEGERKTGGPGQPKKVAGVISYFGEHKYPETTITKGPPNFNLREKHAQGGGRQRSSSIRIIIGFNVERTL